MAESINFGLEAVDFDSAIEEIEVLTPKYLDALEALEKIHNLEEIPQALKNLVSYWERLASLFRFLKDFEKEVNFQDIILQSLQSELLVLEKVYLQVDQKIAQPAQRKLKIVWMTADLVLERMDTVLDGLGFQASHEDRILMAELRKSNALQEQRATLFSA